MDLMWIKHLLDFLMLLMLSCFKFFVCFPNYLLGSGILVFITVLSFHNISVLNMPSRFSLRYIKARGWIDSPWVGLFCCNTHSSLSLCLPQNQHQRLTESMCVWWAMEWGEDGGDKALGWGWGGGELLSDRPEDCRLKRDRGLDS